MKESRNVNSDNILDLGLLFQNNVNSLYFFDGDRETFIIAKIIYNNVAGLCIINIQDKSSRHL